MDDHAVSPVIGTIMLVAITVAMTGAVLLLLNELGDTNDPKPNAAFQKEETANRLVVVSAPHDLDWNHITVRHDGCGVPLLNGIHALLTDTRVTSTAELVDGGDYIQVTPLPTGCTLTLIHIGSNSLMGTWEFR